MAAGKVGQTPVPLPLPIPFFPGLPLNLLTNSSALELFIAEVHVSAVLTTVKDELTALEASKFKTDADVPAGGFGGGGEGSELDAHHARAHGVVVETLTQVIGDLETFHSSIQQAKTLVGEADLDAQAQLTTLLNQVDGLDLGHGAITQAQVNHAYDRPDAAPAADDEDGA